MVELNNKNQRTRQGVNASMEPLEMFLNRDGICPSVLGGTADLSFYFVSLVNRDDVCL